jgi:hypothetical protein
MEAMHMAARRDFGWKAGFVDGYLACLFAFTGHHDGGDVEFIEAVRAFGSTTTLLNRARKNDDIVLPHLRKALREIKRRSPLSVRGAPSEPTTNKD